MITKNCNKAVTEICYSVRYKCQMAVHGPLRGVTNIIFSIYKSYALFLHHSEMDVADQRGASG